VIRLAIFNLDESQTNSFKGLASPANGFFFSFLVYGWRQHDIFSQNEWLIYVLPVIFSLLMVLPFRMFSLKGIKNKANTEKVIIAILVLWAIILLYFFQLGSIPLIVLAYILLSSMNNLQINKN